MMRPRDLILMIIGFSICVTMVAGSGHYVSERLIQAMKENTEQVREQSVQLKSQPICVPVDIDSCPGVGPVNFYQRDDESATEFAQRIKEWVKAFEKGWGQ